MERRKESTLKCSSAFKWFCREDRTVRSRYTSARLPNREARRYEQATSPQHDTALARAARYHPAAQLFGFLNSL